MKKSLIAVIMVCSVFLMAVIANAQAKPGFDDKEIRIAQWGPQTGPAAPWGSVARGSDLLFKIVNEEGGIHGRKIKYFIRDDQYNPAQTKAAVKELIEREGIFAFVGGVGTANGMAVKDYLIANKVIWVNPSTGANDFVLPANPYIFGCYPLYEDEASILTKFMIKKMGIKKLAFFYQNDSYGKDGLKGCKKQMAALKRKLVEEISVEPGEKDVSSQMLRLKNSGAEAVIMWVNPTSAAIALKTSSTIGFKPQWVSSSTLSDYALMNKITGGMWEGVITGAFILAPNSDNPLMVKYRAALKKYAPEERFGAFFIGGILFAEPLVEVLKRTGPNLSTEGCLKQLNVLKNFQGVGPPITWYPKIHQGVDSVQIQKCGPNSSHIVLQDWTSNELATWKKK